MFQFILILIAVYGVVWLARQTVNKRTWAQVSAKFINGKPEDILVLTVANDDYSLMREELVSALLNSKFRIVTGTDNPLVVEDKQSSMNLLNTMYFYPIYISSGAGQTRLEIGIADKSAFLGSKEDRLRKQKALFDYLARHISVQ